MSFKKMCEDVGINYNNAKSYAREHRELNYEQVINYYLNKNKVITFKQMCETASVKYHTAYDYKKSHPELTNEQVINYYLNKKHNDAIDNNEIKHNNGVNKHNDTFKQKCIDAGVDYKKALSYRNVHKELTDVEVINHYKTYISFKNKCIMAGINYERAKSYKKTHKELTEEQVIEHCLKPKGKSFKQKCIDLNLNYETLRVYRSKYSELTDDQVIEHYLKQKKKTFRQKCIENNINYNVACQYKRKYPELTNEQVIERYLNRNYIVYINGNKQEFKSVVALCKYFELNYHRFIVYTRDNKLSITQALNMRIPNSYINLLGELVITD